MSTPVTRRSPAAPALLLVLLAPLAGCGDETGPTTIPEETTTETSTPASETPGEPEGPVDEAVADLAGRLGVAPEDIEVLEAKQVTWRDGSLGCPEPGNVYTQALVKGHRIVLRAGERTFPYHSGGGRGPFLCENLQPSIPPQPGGSE